MRRCLIICAMLLAGCLRAEPPVGPPPVSPDLLQPCPGWQGRAPLTEGQLIAVLAAEKAGRVQCNGKLATIAATLALPSGPPP